MSITEDTDMAPTGAVGDRDPAELVQEARVHGSVYTSQAIFEQELDRIFGRQWVFLVHESEITEPGDYVTRKIGREPVIVARGQDGSVRAFYNRCTHRANLLCHTDQGTASSFRCPYHGWTFRNDGRLTGVPMREGYGSKADEIRERLGLAELDGLESYRGFVFGRLSEGDLSLVEELGAAAASIDRLLALSPDGNLDLRGGWIRHRVKANWKTLVENQVDGYHALFVHQSVYRAISPKRVDYGTPELRIAIRDLGDGHSEIDYADEYRRLGRQFAWFGNISRDRVPDYVAAMERAYGAASDDILTIGPPHTVIFPSLFLAELNLVVFEPIAPDETVVHTAATLLAGGGEMNNRIRRRTEGAMGPAGFLIADDAEMSERNQLGFRAGHPEWVELSRGLEDEVVLDGQTASFDETSETSQRSFWKHYRDVMSGPSRVA